jgi:hypothetical protein
LSQNPKPLQFDLSADLQGTGSLTLQGELQGIKLFTPNSLVL